MTHYTGIDIIEIVRIKKAVERWGERFLHRVYTEAELELCGRKPQSLAVRFAGKEAVMKLLGTGRKGVNWLEIEILARPSGKPFLNLSGNAQDEASKLGVKEIDISLSHSREYAIASTAGNSEVNP